MRQSSYLYLPCDNTQKPHPTCQSLAVQCAAFGRRQAHYPAQWEPPAKNQNTVLAGHLTGFLTRPWETGNSFKGGNDTAGCENT